MLPSSLPGRCGLALSAAGLLTLLINTGLTPRMASDAPFEQTAASSLFVLRQGLSAVTAVLLMFGVVGVHLVQAGRSGRFGGVAFAFALVGCALLLATEWGQVFLVGDLARNVPGALAALEEGGGAGLYDIGTMIALSVFSLGWIALAAASLRAGVLSRRGPLLVVAGLFVLPVLGGALGVWGFVVGNAVLSAGWFLLGRDVATAVAR